MPSIVLVDSDAAIYAGYRNKGGRRERYAQHSKGDFDLITTRLARDGGRCARAWTVGAMRRDIE